MKLPDWQSTHLHSILHSQVVFDPGIHLISSLPVHKRRASPCPDHCEEINTRCLCPPAGSQRTSGKTELSKTPFAPEAANKYILQAHLTFGTEPANTPFTTVTKQPTIISVSLALPAVSQHNKSQERRRVSARRVRACTSLRWGSRNIGVRKEGETRTDGAAK